MQAILEDRATPIVEAYQADFYDLDREALQSLFAPGMKLLWLLHPCGTHLGEVGILHPDHSQMHAALKTYRGSHMASRMELHLIELQEQAPGGDVGANIRQITLDAGFSMIRSAGTRYAMRGDALTKDGLAIASISVKAGNPFGPGRGYRTHVGSHDVLSKMDAIAARMHACQIAAERAGQFTSELACLVNGSAFDEQYPPIHISPVIQGRFAPVAHPRERQAA